MFINDLKNIPIMNEQENNGKNHNKTVDRSKDSMSVENNNCTEYQLPHGWKKVVQRRRKYNKKRWDMYIFTPDGKKLRSNSEIEQFVEDHPDVKCDMEVTNTFKI